MRRMLTLGVKDSQAPGMLIAHGNSRTVPSTWGSVSHVHCDTRERCGLFSVLHREGSKCVGWESASVDTATPPVQCPPSFVSMQRLRVGAGRGMRGLEKRRAGAAQPETGPGPRCPSPRHKPVGLEGCGEGDDCPSPYKRRRKEAGCGVQSRASCQVLEGLSGAAWSPGPWGIVGGL